MLVGGGVDTRALEESEVDFKNMRRSVSVVFANLQKSLMLCTCLWVVNGNQLN